MTWLSLCFYSTIALSLHIVLPVAAKHTQRAITLHCYYYSFLYSMMKILVTFVRQTMKIEKCTRCSKHMKKILIYSLTDFSCGLLQNNFPSQKLEKFYFLRFSQRMKSWVVFIFERKISNICNFASPFWWSQIVFRHGHQVLDFIYLEAYCCSNSLYVNSQNQVV